VFQDLPTCALTSPLIGESIVIAILLANEGFHALQRKIRFMYSQKILRGLSPNFQIHVSVSDLHISTIGPPVFLQPNRQTDRGNI
jgi:hypothetical protein